MLSDPFYIIRTNHYLLQVLFLSVHMFDQSSEQLFSILLQRLKIYHWYLGSRIPHYFVNTVFCVAFLYFQFTSLT